MNVYDCQGHPIKSVHVSNIMKMNHSKYLNYFQ